MNPICDRQFGMIDPVLQPTDRPRRKRAFDLLGSFQGAAPYVTAQTPVTLYLLSLADRHTAPANIA